MRSEAVRPFEPGPGDALLVVHLQNDFLPGGALPVPGGDAVIPVLNRYLREFRLRGLPVFATRDWHPPDHCSFREQGGEWPPHAVAGTEGARFSAALDFPVSLSVVSQASDPKREAYSGFSGTNLEHRLRRHLVHRLFVGGLATDYCVLRTVLDACRLGFEVVLLVDAIRAIDREPGDGARAIDAMVEAGAVQATVEEVLGEEAVR